MKTLIGIMVAGLLLSGPAYASHSSGLRNPDKIECHMPNFVDQNGFAITNPPLSDGTFLFEDVKARTRTYIRLEGTEGSISTYFPFGAGYCIAITYAPTP